MLCVPPPEPSGHRPLIGDGSEIDREQRNRRLRQRGVEAVSQVWLDGESCDRSVRSRGQERSLIERKTNNQDFVGKPPLKVPAHGSGSFIALFGNVRIVRPQDYLRARSFMTTNPRDI